MRHLPISVCAVLIALASAAIAQVSTPSTLPIPATMPSAPALISGDPASPPFIVNGVSRLADDGALGFYVINDGDRQICALFDPADGTPIFLSDGKQTLIYDLMNNRILRVPDSASYVGINWNSRDEKPFSFSFGVDLKTDAVERAKIHSSFRIDLAMSGARSIPSTDNTQLLFVDDQKYVRAVQVPSGEMNWCRFSMLQHGDSYYTVVLKATFGVAAGDAFHFPDLAALQKQTWYADVDKSSLPNVLLLAKNGLAWMPKMGIAAGREWQRKFDKPLLHPDWNQLRKRDQELGSEYRFALAEQGIIFQSPQGFPTTQPSAVTP